MLNPLRQHLQQQRIGGIAVTHPRGKSTWHAQGKAGIVGGQEVDAVAQTHGPQQLASVSDGVPPQFAPVGGG
ncbi:hypothetical protein GCM10027065_33970 [Rhodanobacter koreensis]